MVKRRTRVEMAEANRQAVVEAARQQFEHHGYHGSSLDGIAEKAGFSKGAVYSRFDSKDDLFLAVLADHIEQRHEATAAQFAELAGPGDLPRLAEISIRASVSTVAWQAALLEFRAHAWRHPEINARYAELHRRTIGSIGGFITELYERGGEELPLSADLMAIIGLANGTGVVAEYMTDSDLDVTSLAAIMARSLQPLTAARSAQ